MIGGVVLALLLGLAPDRCSTEKKRQEPAFCLCLQLEEQWYERCVADPDRWRRAVTCESDYKRRRDMCRAYSRR